MTSWLGSAVADKLGDAVAYKTALHNHVKPEPFLLQDVIENGSNLKVRMNMPSASLHVLKLQGQVLIVTDGAVSMQARVSPHAKEQFQNQYKCSLSFVENKTITSTISDITHTTFGSPPSRVQLLLSSFTISNTTMIIDDSRILPIHSIDRIKGSMYRLKQSYQPTAESPTSVEAAISLPNSTVNADLEMVEAPSNISDHVERITSLKRLHSQSSPSQSSSHRLVRPRIHHDNDDVTVQTGINLHQPVQLQSNDSPERSRQLSLLLSRASAAKASASTDREQALRLGNSMRVQMAPPPVPAAKVSNVQPQILSQPLSQPLSQNFESQIPMIDVTIPESSAKDNVSRDTSIVEPQPEIVALNTQPRVNLPNNTPTSAQPEPLEVIQSSLPQAPPPRTPLPSQSEALAASLSTSSSHLLDVSSSSIPRPLYRAPPALMIKYSRRPIPENQVRLLERPSSWWPSRPGTTFPHPNIPVEDLNKLEEAAERRAEKEKEKERDFRLRKETKQESASPSNSVPQETQDFSCSWSSSPESHTRARSSHTRARSRMDTLRRSTNILEPEPPAKLPPGELPPDSSAEYHMQVDEAEVDDSPNHIPSSPPSGSVSQERDDLEIEDLAQSQPNSRQLPEYPLNSPEDDFPTSSFEAEPGKSEKRSPLGKNVNYKRASSPILEVAASPETREGVEKEFTVRVQTLKDDESSVPQVLSHTNITPPILERPQPDDDIVINDQPPVKDNPSAVKQLQDIVTDSPRPQPRRDRRSGWGLEETAETHAQRRNRIRREFMEQRRRETPVAGIGVSATHVTQVTAQADDEKERNQELPVLKTEPQPDPMDVDEPLADLPQPVDDSTVKRANIIDQWRRQSGQEDGNPVIEASMVKPSTIVASSPRAPEQAVSVPLTSKATALGSPMHSVESLPSKPPRYADRQALDPDSANSLPSRPLYHADRQIRDPKAQTRQEIKNGVFGEPTRALWVGSLPAYIDNRQLGQMFAEFDPISASAKKKSGFVNFVDIDTACRALEAKHNSLFDEHRVVCKFASPRGNAYEAPTNLTVDDLFRQFVNKHNFKGNRTAFERLCKKLHTSSDIPLAQWDNYVVLYPAEFLPFANRTVANGEEVPEYDTYWHEQLEKAAKPDMVSVLTPEKLNAVFNQALVVKTPSTKPSVPVTPQTTSGASRPPSKQTPSPASSIVPRVIPDNLRRSVVERNTQNTASTPQQAASHQHDPFAEMLEPRRTSEWLRQNFTKDPQGRVVQSELYQEYKKDCSNATVPWMPGGPFVDHVFNTFPGGRTMSEVDDKGNKIFYCTGLRYKSSARSTPPDVGAPEFKIRGISASNPSVERSRDVTSADRSAQRGSRLSSLGEREGRLGRSLPFMERERRLSRSRSPPRNPPPRAPRGKPSSTDHLLIREGFDADSDKAEYRDFYQKYRSLGNVTKKGNAFSERE